jgi:DNA-binding HxlR family transcriptional regulator
MFHKERTYGDFLKTPEKIATNILASRLQSLEEDGIITKNILQEGRSKFLYRLTEKWIYLVPVLIEIHLWAERYYPVPDYLKDIMEEIHTDKEKVIRETIGWLVQ